MTLITVYKVRETESAVAVVSRNDVNREGVKPLWLPKSKITRGVESDMPGKTIKTAQDGERIGIPYHYEVDAAFLEKVKFQS